MNRRGASTAALDDARRRAFVARFGLTCALLLAGKTRDVSAQSPQAVRSNASPTTLFIGRHGWVKAANLGFAGPGGGQRDVQTRWEVEHPVDTLLAQK